MNKILFIINGESFKSGGSNSRDRGTNDLYNLQQKIACESHIRLFEYIEKKHNRQSEKPIDKFTITIGKVDIVFSTNSV